jgi:hypothetical protein
VSIKERFGMPAFFDRAAKLAEIAPRYKSGSERIDMTKFGGKWHRVDLVEHWDRDPHSADANVVETLDLVNAACTAWLAKKGLLLSWESNPGDKSLQGKIIGITGTIELYQGKPEIGVMSADQIKGSDSQPVK